MQIDLKVKHQRILGVQQIPRLVIEKTTGFVYLNLEFDDEWDGCNIIVLLTNDRQSGNPVQYTWTGEPIEVAPELLETGTLRVSCVGLETDDQGETVQRLTTKRMSEGIRIHRAGDQEGVEPGTTVPGLWEQAMAAMGPLHKLETENKGNMVVAINEIKEIAEIKPNVEIGEVVTGEAGTEAQVTNTGIYPDVKLNFILPRGEEGSDGTTPHIGVNGNWWLGGQDTGVVAEAPNIEIETEFVGMGNQVIPMHRMIITQPDGTKKYVTWTAGEPGQPGRNAGVYYPVLSEDGVLSFQYVGYMQPIPEEWEPTKIVPTKGVDYWTEEEQQEVADAVQAANSSAEAANNAALAVDGAVEDANTAAQIADTAASRADRAAVRAENASEDAEEIAEILRQAVEQGEFNGRDGVSPTVRVLSVPGGHRVYVVDEDGTEFFDVVDGKPGEPGKGLDILGTYPTLDALSAAVPNPEQGDMYNVGSSAPYNIYMYDSQNGWQDQGNLQGARGAVFTPAVDMYGNLSWSNDGGLENPTPVSIKGRDGKTPEKGVDYFTEADKQEIAEQAAGMLEIPTGSWNDLTDKPEAFPPDTHEHSAADITSGVLPISLGGTGAALSRTANGIIRFSSNSAKLSSTATADGAFYATASNGSPKFGTLPVAQGGTGATTAEAARANIGAVSMDDLDSAIASIPTPDVTAQIYTHNTASDAHSDIRTALNKKANDYTIELYNGTSGNPKPVRFASFNYSTCNSENGIAAKISMVSGHGNGSSYAFLQDVIIKVTYAGSVSVDNFKYYGASAGTYDGATRQYGDIFWLVDTTNLIVDFYCLMGQYARMYQTPWKRLTYSTGGAVTQHTSCTVYSSGTMNWANNSEIALLSDIPASFSGSYNDLTDKPTIPSAYSHPSSHPSSMITGLATVATSGSYNDLANKPTIPSAYSHPSTHAASMISAGTFAGQVVANASGQAPGSYLLRNSKISSAAEAPTVNGQICWKYE